MGLLVGSKNAQRFFNLLSRVYDRINPYIYTAEMRDTLLKDVEGEHVLDVGVGTGYTTKHLNGAVGIDLSKEMLLRAKPSYRGSLVLGDATRAPFKPRSFSTIICAGSLYYFNHPVEAVRGFRELLRDGGVVLTITPSWSVLRLFVHIFKKKDLQEIFRNASLKLEKLQNMRGIAYYCKAKKINRIGKSQSEQHLSKPGLNP
jgi:demethylmenaquinone methyltransferase/2-methoxy-6-polyprenyl-1,4-benzoquinol methylase